MDLINVEGWIPREQILGLEARAKVQAVSSSRLQVASQYIFGVFNCFGMFNFCLVSMRADAVKCRCVWSTLVMYSSVRCSAVYSAHLYYGLFTSADY